MRSVHLTSARPVTRANFQRARRLNETGMPATKKAEDIIAWLQVEKSARYKPTADSTFCNIYAYDYATLMGKYIPRVWWSADALMRIKQGEEVAPEYGTSVREMTANMLYQWFLTWGESFGWRSVSANEAQEQANEGKCVIGVAAKLNKSQSGHIVAVAPEGENGSATRVSGMVTVPLQSQAGRTNFRYKAAWWWGKGYENMMWYVAE
jgi:hypothetical protein